MSTGSDLTETSSMTEIIQNIQVHDESDGSQIDDVECLLGLAQFSTSNKGVHLSVRLLASHPSHTTFISNSDAALWTWAVTTLAHLQMPVLPLCLTLVQLVVLPRKYRTVSQQGLPILIAKKTCSLRNISRATPVRLMKREVDGTYILELHKDERKGEAKATIVMDFCTEVLWSPKRGRYCMELQMPSGHKSYCLAAESEHELQDWLSKLQLVLQINRQLEEKPHGNTRESKCNASPVSCSVSYVWNFKRIDGMNSEMSSMSSQHRGKFLDHITS